MTTNTVSAAPATPAAPAAVGPATRNDPGRAAAFFAARLDFQTDVSDVHAGLTRRHPNGGLSGAQSSEPGGGQGGALGDAQGGGQDDGLDSRQDGGVGFVLVDSRSRAAWEQGHIPGAVHLPTAEIGSRAAKLLDPAVPVVTYCWGPGCNGATRAALALALAGYSVKEMLGGVEYWVREGLTLRTPEGDVVADADPLTAPVAQPSGASCGC